MNQNIALQPGMLRTNLRGQIRQTQLPRWKALLPLFEAVMNSFQAIQDAKSHRRHRVTIVVERDADLIGEDNAPIVGFEIRDTGIGFTDENFDSFNTAYSEHKYERGGKGLGRFMWLKAFETVHVRTTFQAQDGDDEPSHWLRDFEFGFDYDPDAASAAQIDSGASGTTVRLGGFLSPYREECPVDIEILAQRLAEHFILVLMQSGCPEVEIIDGGIKLSLNKVFDENFQRGGHSEIFEIAGRSFRIDGFRLHSPRASKHRLIYAANSRAVITERLDQFIPNFIGRLQDDKGNSFVYLAVVQGDYLNDRVNNFRTDFDIHEELEDGQGDLLQVEDLRRSDIRTECLAFVQRDLAELIDGLNAAKAKRVLVYVRTEAPQYKPLLRYLDQFIGSISPNASKMDMELALHRELHQREVSLKKEGSRILTEAARQEDYEGYRQRLSEFMERSNELGVSALAQYVSHRKIIIELLEKALSNDKRTGKYPLEEAVHNILFPMRATDQDILYSQQNLWIIDERLNFHSFIASDRPLNSHTDFNSESRKRPDLFIFDRKITFSEKPDDGMPLNSITVIEFKRPQRDDYNGDDNPLRQVFEQIQLIRGGQFRDDNGRPLAVAGDKIPAFAYVVCDITPSMHAELKMSDAMPTPDQRSYYGYHRTFGIYFEVIDYGRLLADAKRRNRVFFERLNLMDAQCP
ncbi:ATP-binding protein [Mesorhizobium sp. M0644]|uniref:ATP-binding protein n=1 Tax=Mesorhizobium sp. M0644 TaxID=2956979 RepID=UPI00333CFEE6